jgi:hypothetical protein
MNKFHPRPNTLLESDRDFANDLVDNLVDVVLDIFHILCYLL